MIGDTPYDAEAALGASTSAVGVLTGGFSRETLAEAGCFAVAKELQDLLTCLASSPPGGGSRVNQVLQLMAGRDHPGAGEIVADLR